MAFSQDGSKLITAGGDGVAFVWRVPAAYVSAASPAAQPSQAATTTQPTTSSSAPRTQPTPAQPATTAPTTAAGPQPPAVLSAPAAKPAAAPAPTPAPASAPPSSAALQPPPPPPPPTQRAQPALSPNSADKYRVGPDHKSHQDDEADGGGGPGSPTASATGVSLQFDIGSLPSWHPARKEAEGAAAKAAVETAGGVGAGGGAKPSGRWVRYHLHHLKAQ